MSQHYATARSIALPRAESQGRASRWVEAGVVALLCLLAVTLFYAVFSRESLRLDESQSLWQASRSLPAVYQIVAQDVHVPLYHTLLHVWMTIFGMSVFSARALSMLFFVLSIVAIYAFGRRYFGRSEAMFASLIFTLSPFMNWYGSEIRMYSLMTFLVIMNQYFFLGLAESGEEGSARRWFGYTLTAVLGVYTHYFFLFALLAQGLFFLAFRKRFQALRFKHMAATAAVVAGSLIPWALYVANLGFANNMKPLIPTPGVINVFNTFSNFVFGFQGDGVNSLLLSLWPLSVLFLFLALQKNRSVSPVVMYCVFAVAVPIMAAFAVSKAIRPIYLSRYMIMTLPAFYLLVAWLFSAYPKRVANASKTFLTGMVMLMLAMQTTNAAAPVKEAYREAAEFLNANAAATDVIAVSAPFTIYPVEYYYSGKARLTTIPEWNRFQKGAIPTYSPEKLDEQAKAMSARHDVVWLLLSYDQGYEKEIKEYFDARYPLVSRREFSHDLTLYQYQVRTGAGLRIDVPRQSAPASGAATTSASTPDRSAPKPVKKAPAAGATKPVNPAPVPEESPASGMPVSSGQPTSTEPVVPVEPADEAPRAQGPGAPAVPAPTDEPAPAAASGDSPAADESAAGSEAPAQTAPASGGEESPGAPTESPALIPPVQVTL